MTKAYQGIAVDMKCRIEGFAVEMQCQIIPF